MNRQRYRFQDCRILAAISVAVFIYPNEAQSALIIDIQDTTIVAGGFASIDVLIRSDGTGVDGTDKIAALNYLLRITAINELGGDLKFANDSSSADAVRQLSGNDQLDPNYIFFSQTEPGNYVSERTDTNDRELTTIDFTSLGNDVSVDTSNFLLGRIELRHDTITPLTATGQYRISLDPNPAQTAFFDSNFSTPVPINPLSFDLTDNAYHGSGVVTVLSASAVPEPSSMAMLALLAAGGFMYRRRGKSHRIA